MDEIQHLYKVHIVNTPIEFSSCLQGCLLLTMSLGWIQAIPRPDEHVRVTDKHRNRFAEKLSDTTERLQDQYHLPIIPSPLLAVKEDVTRLKHLDWTPRSRSKRENFNGSPELNLVRGKQPRDDPGSVIYSPQKPWVHKSWPKCLDYEVYDKILKRCVDARIPTTEATPKCNPRQRYNPYRNQCQPARG